MNHVAVSLTDSARQPAGRGGEGGLPSPPRPTVAQRACLRVLAAGPATPEQVARARWREGYGLLSRRKLAHTARVLDRLVRQGLATRRGIPWNVEYALTPAGEALAARLRERRRRHAG